jgi:hypothetical protein
MTCHYAECRYAEYRYAECHSAEYRGTLNSTDTSPSLTLQNLSPAVSHYTTLFQ